MLLACSGDASADAVEAMQNLLQEGAVPDTWAPNGSSVSTHALLLGISFSSTSYCTVALTQC